MTIDLLAATLFWPEGTLLHLRDDLSSEAEHDDPPPAETPDPLLQSEGESFWTGVFRHIGWPLPAKPAVLR